MNKWLNQDIFFLVSCHPNTLLTLTFFIKQRAWCASCTLMEYQIYDKGYQKDNKFHEKFQIYLLQVLKVIWTRREL